MTDIDPTTNLPQLPEDHFWRISEHEIAVMKHVPAGEWSEWEVTKGHLSPGAYRETVTNSEVSNSTDFEVRRVDSPQKSLFGRVKFYIHESRERTSAEDKWVTGAKYGEWETSWLGEKVYFVVLDPVTPENVLERTTEVYNEWQAKIAREALYGNYPPKKLEASND